MISSYTLHKDRIASLSLRSAVKQHSLVWVRCVAPSDSEIRELCNLLREQKDETFEEIKDFLAEDERPRLDTGKVFELIYEAPFKEETLETEPIMIFIDRNFIVTIEKQPIATLESLESRAKSSKIKFLMKKNPGNFMYYILDSINDEFLNHINMIGDSIKIFKQTTTETMKQKAEKIFSTSVTLSFFHQAIIANLEVLNSLKKVYFKQFTADNKEDFAELYYDVLQLLDTERIQRDTVSNLFNLQSIISSNRLNIFIKRLTSVALIVMIPTLISGIYGMNVTLPLQDNPNAFYYITIFMFGISVLLLLIFKKLDWL